MKRFLVIGLGRFGTRLAETLFSEGDEVIAVDQNMDRVEEIKERVSHAVRLDGADPDALKSVGADRVDAAVVAIGENFEASVITTVILKELGLKEIIARANTEREKRILQLIGATRVIFVEDEMGRRLGKAISGNSILDYIELSSTHSIVKWETPERLAGEPLLDLQLQKQWGLTLLAVKKGGNQKGTGEDRLEFNPPPEYRIEKGDILVLVGRNKDLSRFTEKEQ